MSSEIAHIVERTYPQEMGCRRPGPGAGTRVPAPETTRLALLVAEMAAEMGAAAIAAWEQRTGHAPDYLTTVGLVNTATSQAREVVLQQELYAQIPPDPEPTEDLTTGDPEQVDWSDPDRWRTPHRSEPTEQIEELVRGCGRTGRTGSRSRRSTCCRPAARTVVRAEQPRERPDPAPGPARGGRPRQRRAAARVDESQFSLFDVTDQPTDPRVIDPGGVPLPPARPRSASRTRTPKTTYLTPDHSPPPGSGSAPYCGAFPATIDWSRGAPRNSRTSSSSSRAASPRRPPGPIACAHHVPGGRARRDAPRPLDLQAAEPRRAAARRTRCRARRRPRRHGAPAHRLHRGPQRPGGTEPIRCARQPMPRSTHTTSYSDADTRRPGAADTRAAQLADLRQRIDRIRTQIELHPAPEWAGWGLEYRRGLPDQLAAAREELTGLEHPAAPPTAGGADPTAAPREAPRDVAVAGSTASRERSAPPADTPDASFTDPGLPAEATHAAYVSALAALQAASRDALVSALQAMGVPPEDAAFLPDFADHLLLIDEPTARARVREIAEMNTRDSQQYKSRQLLADPPSIGAARPADNTTAASASRAPGEATADRGHAAKEASSAEVPAAEVPAAELPAAELPASGDGRDPLPAAGADRPGHAGPAAPDVPSVDAPEDAPADAPANVERGAANFDLGVQVRVPSGATARAQANLARSASSGTSKPSSGPRRTTNSRSWRGGRGGVRSPRFSTGATTPSASSATSSGSCWPTTSTAPPRPASSTRTTPTRRSRRRCGLR